MNKKIWISFLILIALICATGFLPFNKWVKLDDFKTNLVESAEWSVQYYDVDGKILTMMSTPVAIPHSKKLKLSGALIIQSTSTNSEIEIPDLPLTIDLYGGAEFDSPENDINITYQQAKAGATFEGTFEIDGKQTNLFLRIFHYYPGYQVAGKFELHAQPNFLQNVIFSLNKIKKHFSYILIALILGSVLFIFSKNKKVVLISSVALILFGLIIYFIPIKSFSGKNIIQKQWNKKTDGTNKLKLLETGTRALPIIIESNKYYVISWKDRLLDKPNPKNNFWRLDLFGKGGQPDYGSQETNRRFSNMKSNFSKNNFIIYSKNFHNGYIRLMGPWGNGIEISDLSISEMPGYIVKIKQISNWCIIFGILLLLLYFKKIIINIYTTFRTKLINNKITLVILTLAVYFIPCLYFLKRIWSNRGNEISGELIYRFAGAPILIIVVLFLAGWPFVRWCLKGKQKKTSEFLLSFPVGFLILLSTHSLSYLGLSPSLRLIIFWIVLLIAWAITLYKKEYPALPDVKMLPAIIIAVLLFWIGITPLLTQTDTYGFTLTNNDISTYIPFVQWDMEHSMKEAYDLSLKNQEPPYIGFMAWRMRQNPVAFGNYTAIAALAAITGLSAYQIYPLMSGVFLSIIFLSIIGSLLTVKLIRKKDILIASTAIAFNFLLLNLAWESFYSSMVGFTSLFLITAIGTYAFLKRKYRFSLITGLGLASLLNAYPQYFYMVCAQLFFALLIIFSKELFFRNWNNVLKIIIVGLCILSFTLLFAPQQTSRFIKQTVFKPNAVSSMSKNTDGGKNFPNRSYYLINGFLGDWTYPLSNRVHIPTNFYKIGSLILSIAFVVLLLRLILFKFKTWKALFIFSSTVPYALMIAWAFFKVPNRYIYFKALGYVAPFVSAAFVICWLDWHKETRIKFIKGFLIFLMVFWIAWRLIAVCTEILYLKPNIFIGKPVTSLEKIYDIVPKSDTIRINFTEWFNSAHIVTILRHRKLDIIKPFSYVPKSYRQKDYQYILENKKITNKKDIWNNGTYFLYKK